MARSDESLRSDMLSELRSLVSTEPLPERAMTMREIMEATPGTTEDQWHRRLRPLVRSGAWVMRRVGTKVYYWKK